MIGPPLPADARKAIIDVLCGQALADHLGDVRNEEETLWRLLGAGEWSYKDEGYDDGSAWRNTRARLAKFDLPLPEYLQGDDDDE